MIFLLLNWIRTQKCFSTNLYGGLRRTVCRTQSWFFWPGKLLVSMTSLRQKMTGFMSPFRIYFHINNCNIPRQWKVMTVFSVERFPGPLLWRRFSLNWRKYPKIWKLVWKGLLPSFQKSIHCPRDTRSLPFQKNQDCFFFRIIMINFRWIIVLTKCLEFSMVRQVFQQGYAWK